MEHYNYETQLPNGWSFITEFLTLDSASKEFDTAAGDYVDLDRLKILHAHLLQYFNSFGSFPNIGEQISDEVDFSMIKEKMVYLDRKKIILSLY